MSEEEVTESDRRHSFLVEVCVDSLQAAQLAMAHGAGRLEVCSRLAEGGYTPCVDLMDAVLDLRQSCYPECRVFAMVRPWLGGKTNFVYSTSEERDALFSDAEAMISKGVDGIVVGALIRRADGQLVVDRELMTGVCLVADRSNVADVTFHRAFDDINKDREESINVLGSIGNVTRILTSGGRGQAARVTDEGNFRQIFLNRLLAETCGITVLPGSGINPQNVRDVVKWTGCQEVHGSFGQGTLVKEVVDILKVVDMENAQRQTKRAEVLGDAHVDIE